MTIALVISIVSLLIAMIVAIRIFLMDKDYGEFVIENYDICNNSGLSYETLKEKEGYKLTMFNPKLRLIKSDIYNVDISGVDIDGVKVGLDIKPFKNVKITKINSDDSIHFNNILISRPIEITILYQDSKNNKYRQVLNVEPFYLKSNSLFNIKSNIKLSVRKWIFFTSLLKYFK